MKKAISLTIIIVILLLGYQIFATSLKKEHNSIYSFKKDNIEFKIDEKFSNNKYYFDISSGKYNFIFSFDNQFSKKKQVIKDIKYVKDENMLCIYPVYDNNNGGNLICSDSNLIYNYSYTKTLPIVSNFISKLEKDGYNTEFSIEDYSDVSVFGGTTVYKKYINETIALWEYTGINIIKDKTHYKQELLTFDRYENTLGTIVDKYYIMPNYFNNKTFEADGFYIINLKNNDVDLVNLDFPISNLSYINGIVNNKLYIFDKKSMKQIEIDPKKKKIKNTSNSETAKFYNGEWSDRNIFDFKNQEIAFNRINKDLNSANTYEGNDCYYIFENNNMFKIYKNNLDKKILLFNNSNVKEIKVVKDNLYYIVDNDLYRYNDKDLVKKLLKNSELKYNYKNIINIYK